MHDSGDLQRSEPESRLISPLEAAIDCQPLSVTPKTTLLDVVTLMSQGSSPAMPLPGSNLVKRSSYALVMDGAQLMGILTERDVVKFATQGIDFAITPVADVMTQQLITLPEAGLQHPFAALSIFRQYRIRHLPILDQQGHVVGVATPNSIRHTLQASDLFRLCRVEEVMSPQAIEAPPEATVLELAQLMATHRVSCVVITQPGASNSLSGRSPIGIVTERDVVQFQALGLSLTTLQAQAVMSGPLVCLSPQDTLWTAHQTMERMRVRRLVVTDGQETLVGIVTQTSILSSLDPLEMQKTITCLQQQVERLQNERMQWLQNHATQLENQVQTTEQRYANLAEAAPVGIFQTDADGHCLYVNHRWCQIAGMPSDSARGTGWVQGIHPADRETVAAEWYRAAQARQPFHLEYRFQTGAGRVTWVVGRAIAETDAEGQISGYIGTITDITEHKQSELALAQLNQQLETRVAQRTAELAASQERYRLLYKKTPVMLHSIDGQGQICHVSEHWLETLGYTREEVIGRKATDFLTPKSRHFAETVVLPEYFQIGLCKDVPYQMVSKQGEVIDVLLSATNEQDESGQTFSLAVMVDVTERNRVAKALFREKELAQVTLHSIADAVITTDAFGRVEYFNPIAEHLTGWQAAEAKGELLTEVFEIIHETTRAPVENPVERILRTAPATELTTHPVLVSRQGAEYSIESSAAPIRDRKGDMIGTVIVFRDVTQSRQLARQLSWQASHDPLTGLANRRQFEQDLSKTLENTQKSGQLHVLCYLDLDQFKVVNDTCGHLAGDDLLRQVSKLLRGQIRATDTLARLGGDEFGILLKQCPLERAERIAEKCRKAVQQFRFLWQDRTFSLGVSIGLVALDTESHTLTDVLSAADAACYAAKDQGRNRIHIYQVDDSELLKQRGERQWSVHIRQALEDNRFCLYRQAIAPIVPSEDNQPSHYEILLRMVDEQGNLVLPDAFIPSAERYDLMPAIDRWVVQAFFAQVERL
ncbi:MAG: PAS domain S-box protein, partial [Cyanobacteria bacterium P01_F01_bin.4]